MVRISVAFSKYLKLAFSLLCVLTAHTMGQVAITKSTFPERGDTQATPNGVTTPEEALAAIRVPPGFRATLFASEPAVRQPIALATDSRGRLWVAENYTYAERETNFDKQARDRIVILEDKNKDGKFDQRTVFWDQANKLTSIEVGFGGVWALCPPHLLFLPDRNGDDVPDGPPQVMLDGWNDDAVRHNIANGLRWGPDGWLYGRHGILATSQVGEPSTPNELRTKINCGIWRYHPTRHDFEAVCHGTTNPWGMDWDEHGQFFFINTVIGHLWHVLPGAHFQRMYGEDLQPNLFELIPQTADHFHWDTAEVWSDIRTIGVSPTTDQAGGGHAHSGLLIYQGGVWPQPYHNTVLTVNLHGRRLNNDRIERAGSGYVAKHGRDFLSTSDPWFRGVELASGPSGEIYLADWSDIGECHENDGVHRSTGRIFQIQFVGDGKSSASQGKAENAQTFEDLKLHSATDVELVSMQMHKNEWLVRQARLVLQERAAAGRDMAQVHAELLKAFESEAIDTRVLRAMWGLHATGGAGDPWLQKQLNHPSEHVRAWAVQLLCDRGLPSDSARQLFLRLAERESSGLVLSLLASALQRLPLEERPILAAKLAAHAEFATDARLPLMIWYGVEPSVAIHPALAIQLAGQSQMPKLREFIARRLTSEIDRQPAAVNSLLAVINKASNDADKLAFLKGMATALHGWRKAKPPEGWSEFSQSLSSSKNSDVQRLVRELSVVFGDGRALNEVRKIAETSSPDIEGRRAALRTLVLAKAENLSGLLQKLMGDRDLQLDAIRGLAGYDDPRTPHLLIDKFVGLQPPSQREAIDTLVSRPAYAKVLLAGVTDGRIPRQQVSPFHLRQMTTLGDADITQRVTSMWPELQQLSEEKSRRIAMYRHQLTTDYLSAANLSQGRAVFQRVCASCHILFGQGTKVGPDLTGAQRTNLNYLLENIVDPSATVAENFRMSVITVADGRVINGVLSEKTDRTVTIATPTSRVVLASDEIEEIRPSNLSIMPEGQLDVLPAEQVRDLIGYLMSPEQVPLQ